MSPSNKLKVVFFGTPAFAAYCLQAIIDSPHDVVGVVTVADKPSGRGQRLHQSEVKSTAQAYQIPVFQPTNLKSKTFLEEMKALQADVFVVVAFRMMPAVLFEMPPLGTFNLHASLLPDYRGAAPINYAIMNGETTTGVTTFFINQNIDEGNILLQEKTTIAADETAGELHDRLMHLGGRLIVKTLDQLAGGSARPTPQTVADDQKTAYKIFKEDTRIDWSLPGENIHNFIRGLSPYPAAFTEILLNGERKTLKIYKGNFQPNTESTAAVKLIWDKTSLQILLPNGCYNLTEVQLEGKRRMTTKDFLNGIRPTDILELP